ncbi:MAG TPA: hypothetical protein VF708_09210 [Pyrinomonadaceae bacterium]
MTAKASTKAKAKARTRKKEEPTRQGSLPWLWAGVLVAPLAFLLNLQVNYTLTQKLCPGGRSLVLHIMALCFLLLAAGGGLIAWRNWTRAGRGWPDESEDNTVRNRFLATIGLMISFLFSLVIIALWIPQFIFDPCQR